MLDIVLLHLHLIAALYAFVQRWQEENAKEGVLAVALIGLVFAIGWTITGTVARFIMPEQSGTPWFTADTLSLLLLFIPEVFLFRAFFLSQSKKSILNSRTGESL